VRPSPRYDINLSILFTELEVLRRPAAAKAAGFDEVEFWWPFAEAEPGDRQVDEFVRAIEDAGVRLVGLNFFAGDMASGDRGLVSWTGREKEFHANIAVAVDVADRLGCKAFNALYGNRIDGVPAREQDELATENLTVAARAAEKIDATVLIEPVSGASGYPLLTAADALKVMDEARQPNLALLADLYHLHVNGDDLDAVIDAHTPRIGHVQIADSPGRHEPGTGELDIVGYLAKLAAAGYTGRVGLEYKPSGASADSFGWMSSAATRNASEGEHQ
jgi:hydroxypyruvate isomerase